MLYLEEDESFSMTANVESAGYQRIALKGFLVRRDNNGVYIGSLLPQMFYGASGTQLSTWRQYLPTSGSQVILSRTAGGDPEVPKEEIYWRKVADLEQVTTPTPVAEPIKAGLEVPSWALPLVIGVGALAVIIYFARK